MAILFSTLAPTVSHALARSDTVADLVVLCTSNGKVLTPASGDDGNAPAPAKHMMEHCAFCTTHGGAHLAPPPTVALLLPTAGRAIYPPLFYHAPQPLSAWSAANPRAPPPLS